jgi:NADH-quinone oxidoreductase subunit D
MSEQESKIIRMTEEELKDNKLKRSINYSEDIEKEIDFLFGNKIGAVYNYGRDILFDVVPENLSEVINVLKNNPDLEFDILSYIKYKEQRNFLIIGLLSYNKGVTINIRVRHPFAEKRTEYKSVIDSVRQYYETAEYYTDRHYLKDASRDAVILSQTPETLDSFDIYLSFEDDIITKAYLSNDISSFNQSILFKISEINKIIASINILSYKAAIFPEICFCMGIENLLSMKIPKRAVYLRMLLCELFRISSHLSFIVNTSLVIGSQYLLNYVLTEREKVLNIIEMITGSRIIPNFTRIGGVKKDIDENTLKTIFKSLPVIFKNIRRIEDSFSSDIVILRKLKEIGNLNVKQAQSFALTGPNLRASGFRYDMRKDPGHLLYKDFPFTIPLGRYGDNLDRVIIRFKEIYQSLKIINEIIRIMPVGPVDKMFVPSSIEYEQSSVISSVECPDGIFKLYIEIHPDSKIEIIPIGPLSNNMFACEKTLEGCNFNNLLTTISSFCIESPEMY